MQFLKDLGVGNIPSILMDAFTTARDLENRSTCPEFRWIILMYTDFYQSNSTQIQHPWESCNSLTTGQHAARNNSWETHGNYLVQMSFLPLHLKKQASAVEEPQEIELSSRIIGDWRSFLLTCDVSKRQEPVWRRGCLSKQARQLLLFS